MYMHHSFFIFGYIFIVSIYAEISTHFIKNISSKYLNYTFGKCIGSGFKNIVLSLLERPDLIVRIGLIHNGDSVLNFRNESAFGIFSSALNDWIRNYPNNSFEANILHRLKDCNIGTCRNKDIVPRKDIENEVLFERMSQSRSQLVFQISGNLYRIELPLPRTQFIQSDISAVLEYNLKMTGDISKLEDGDLTEIDLFRLLLGIFNDQLTFKESTGTFHFDGHIGNILFQRGRFDEIFFVWSDFGKTSSSSSYANQFKNSMMSINNYIRSRSRNYPKVNFIMTELSTFSKSFDGSILIYENNLFKMKELIEKYLMVNYAQSFIENLIVKLSPTSQFGIRYLSERISSLEVKVIEQGNQITLLLIKNKEQNNQIALLLSKNNEQSNQINEQSNQIALLLSKTNEQDIQIKKLRNQVHFLISKSHEKSQISDTDIGGEIFLDIADDRANDL